MTKSNNTGKLIGALLLGTAIGGALGILLAPSKRSKKLKKLSAKGDDLADAMKGKFKDYLEEVKKEVETAKNKTIELMKNGIAKAEKFKVN